MQIRDGEAQTVTESAMFTTDVGAASSVLIGVGTWDAQPATWVAPGSFSFSSDGTTVTVTTTLGNGFINAAGAAVVLWVKVVCAPQVLITQLGPDVFEFVDTGGTPPATLPVFVVEVLPGSGLAVDNADPTHPVVSITADLQGVSQVTLDAAIADEVTRADGAYDGAGAASSAVTAHDAAPDPHPQYLTAAEGAASFDPLGSASSALTTAEGYTDTKVAAEVTRANVAYDPAGAASSAQTTAETYTDTKVAAEVVRADGAYATAAQGAKADTATQPGDLGTAAAKNVGNASGQIPLLNASGRFDMARLASGTPDGTKFVRDDGTLAAPSAAVIDYRPMIAGRFYPADLDFSAVDGGGTMTAGRAVFAPLRVYATRSFDRMGMNVATAGGAGTVLRLGIYAARSDGRPGSLVLDALSISCATSGDKTLTIAQALPPGLYYLACVTDDSSGTLRVRKTAGTVNDGGTTNLFGSAGLDIGDAGSVLTYTGYTAGSPWPGTATIAGEGTLTQDIPLVFVRAA